MYGAIIIGASSETKCTISNPSFITSIQLGLFSLKYKCLSSDTFFDTAIKASCPRRSSATIYRASESTSYRTLSIQAAIVWLSNIRSSDHSVIRSSNYPIIKSSDHPIPDSAIFPPIAQWSKADGLYFIGLKNISFSSVEVLFLRGFVFLSHIIILPHHVCF